MNSGRLGTESQNSSSSVTRSKQRQYLVEPARFMTLQHGGYITDSKSRPRLQHRQPFSDRRTVQRGIAAQYLINSFSVKNNRADRAELSQGI